MILAEDVIGEEQIAVEPEEGEIGLRHSSGCFSICAL